MHPNIMSYISQNQFSVFVLYTGATHMMFMLMENNKLQHLDISGNKIGDDGVIHIAMGLRHNDTLTELILANCEISAKGNCN